MIFNIRMAGVVLATSILVGISSAAMAGALVAEGGASTIVVTDARVGVVSVSANDPALVCTLTFTPPPGQSSSLIESAPRSLKTGVNPGRAYSITITKKEAIAWDIPATENPAYRIRAVVTPAFKGANECQIEGTW